jgi:nitrogen fixation NifU-like protein
MLTDEIKGKPLSEIARLGQKEVLENLGIEVSPARLKCAMLSLETLQAALADKVAWQGAGGPG